MGKQAYEARIGRKMVEKAHPLRFIFSLEYPVTVDGEIEYLLLREEFRLFLQKERLVLVVVEEHYLSVRYLGEEERDERLYLPDDIYKTIFGQPIHKVFP